MMRGVISHRQKNRRERPTFAPRVAAAQPDTTATRGTTAAPATAGRTTATSAASDGAGEAFSVEGRISR